MTERAADFVVALIYSLAVVSGGLGGCTVAAHHIIKGKSIRLSFFFGYAIIGAVFGLLTASYGSFLSSQNWHEIIGPSILAGAGGAIALSATNLSARFILKKLGVEVVVTVKKSDNGAVDA